MKRPTLQTVTAILLGIGLYFFTFFVVDLLLLAGVAGADTVDGAINIVVLGLVILLLALDLSAPEKARSWPVSWPRNRQLRLLGVLILLGLIGLATAQLLSLLLYEFVRILALLFFIYHAGKAEYRVPGIVVTAIAVMLIIASSFAMDNQGFLALQDFLFSGGALFLAWRRTREGSPAFQAV